LKKLLLLMALTMLGGLLFASVALAQDPCPDPNYPRQTPDGCQASDLPDVVVPTPITGPTTATATSSPTATSTATSSGTATATATANSGASSAASAAGGSLPDTGGPTSPLVEIAALMLLAGAGVMSFAIVRRAS
jgi:hypothetical protein